MNLVLIRAITLFCSILQMMLFVTAILSWFAGANQFIRGLYQLGMQMTEPLVAPIRKLIGSRGQGQMMIDFAPLITFLLIGVVERMLIKLILVLF